MLQRKEIKDVAEVESKEGMSEEELKAEIKARGMTEEEYRAKEAELLPIIDAVKPGKKWSQETLAALKKAAEDITDPAMKEMNLVFIEGWMAKTYQAEGEAVEKENNEIELETKDEQTRNEELKKKQTQNVSLADIGPEHSDLLDLHLGFKDIVQKYNIDLSEARTRSAAEHNALVAEFVLWSLAPSASMLEIKHNKSRGYGGSEGVLNSKCLQGSISAAPGKYCWKPWGEHSFGPSECAHPYSIKWGAECFKNCNGGYYWVGGGTCWRYCDSGYSDHGATCYWSWWCWYAKHHYWTSRRHKSCPTNYYKSGLLCYRPCSHFGETEGSYEGCGDLACGSTAGMCAATIINMVFEIGFAVASIAALVATGGAAAAAAPAAVAGKALVAKGAAKTMVKATASSIIRAGFARFQKAAFRGFKNAMVGVKETVLKNKGKYIFECARDGYTENVVKNFCKEYQKATYNRLDPKNANSFDPLDLDPIGITDSVKKCKDSGTASCAGAIVGAIGTFDPTGLMGVAAAFMHDDCALPSKESSMYAAYWSAYR
jgi:hypothetical protein